MRLIGVRSGKSVSRKSVSRKSVIRKSVSRNKNSRFRHTELVEVFNNLPNYSL